MKMFSTPEVEDQMEQSNTVCPTRLPNSGAREPLERYTLIPSTIAPRTPRNIAFVLLR
jgi:hypothetical protein